MKTIYTILFLFLGLIVFTVIIKSLWSYLVIRLFPGAVEQNLISKEISWKVSMVIAVIFLLIK